MNKEEIKFIEVKQPQPHFRVRTVTETGNMSEIIHMHGKAFGKDEKKHIRFWNRETDTAYICWYAPAELRLAVSDLTKKTIYLHCQQAQKKNKEGNAENYFRVVKYAISNEVAE